MKNLLLITMLLGVGYSQCNETNWQTYYPDMADQTFLGQTFLRHTFMRQTFLGQTLNGHSFIMQTFLGLV